MKNLVVILSILLLNALHLHCQVIHFDSGSSNITVAEKQELEKWMVEHTAQKTSVVTVKGYCDEHNTAEFNTRLSMARCNAVTAELMKNGFSNVKELEYGESHPLCDDTTAACHAMNRRVEIVISPLTGGITDHFAPKPVQVFFIDPALPSEITGIESTKIQFPAFCFIDADGKTVKTKVRVELREFYNAADMILNGLATSSGDQMIETAGSVDLRVFSGNEQLTMRDGKVYSMLFPTRKVNDGMITFYAGPEDGRSELTVGVVNWVAASDVPYKYIFRDLQLYNNPVLRDKAFTAVRSHIDKNPEYIKVRGVNKIDFGKNRDGYTAGAFEIEGQKYSLLYEEHFCYFLDTAQYRAGSGNPDTTGIFTISTQLGLINCDRWANSGRTLTDVAIAVPSPSTYYYMIFPGINSIMPGYGTGKTIHFPNVPEGEKATVIAIEVRQDRIFFGAVESVCSDIPVLVETCEMHKDEVHKAIGDLSFDLIEQ